MLNDGAERAIHQTLVYEYDVETVEQSNEQYTKNQPKQQKSLKAIPAESYNKCIDNWCIKNW